MAEPFCDHCDLPLSQCIHGRPPAEHVGLGPIVDGPTITATQYGRCEECGRSIEPGVEITHTDMGWVHAEHVADQKSQPQTDLFDGM